MKKTHLLKLSAFVVLCFMLTICTFALDYEFNTEGPHPYFSANPHVGDIAVKDGCYTYKTVNTDPQLFLINKYNASTKSGGLTDATINKTFEIKFSTTLPPVILKFSSRPKILKRENTLLDNIQRMTKKKETM